MGETQVINLWTNPRSLSTCLTYAFAQRSDTQVLDEPLHSFYIHTQMSPEAKQLFLAPLKSDAQLNIEERDGNKVIDMILDTSGCPKKYRFCKHMAIYFANRSLNPDLLAKSKHIILIRNPIHCLASFAKIWPTEFVSDWTSISYMYSELLKMGKNPSIVDAQDLQDNPEGTLKALCHALNMEFQPQMLKWEVGPKEFDVYQSQTGSIGSFYQDVHQSTGFLPEPSYWSGKPFPMELYPELRASWPPYLMLKKQAIRPVSQNPVERNLTITRQTLVWVHNSLVPMEFAPHLNQETEDIHESLLISEHKIFKLKEKISRLREIAQAQSLADVPDYKTIKSAIFSTALANGMFDKARLHVTLSRAKGSCMLSVTGEEVEVWDETEVQEGTDATMIP